MVIRPIGDQGRHVIKHPGTGEFFQVGPEEHFLIMQLDGRQDAETACQAFVGRFGQALTEKEMHQFVEMARRQGLLEEERRRYEDSPRSQAQLGNECETQLGNGSETPSPSPAPLVHRQSILYWRATLFDPERVITWLEPKLRFCWTGAFLACSAAWIALALVLVWVNGGELVTRFQGTLSFQTFALAWLTMMVVTTLHEFAHGLTCKHHGGDVHEIGFLLMYFMPCFFWNVSDAWLFKEKSKRLWVMFAGGYCEMLVWALAVFAWRLTVPDSLTNYLAWVVMTVCGVRTLFNFNPLLKLDGYYMLSDWLEVPNLRQRAWQHLSGHVRWLLWGAPRPARQPRGRVLLGFGVASWLYSIVFLALMLWAFSGYFWSRWGWLGLGGVALLGWASVPGLFYGFSAGEVRKMFRLRQHRTAVWLVLLGAGAAALVFVQVEDRSSGPLLVRAASRMRHATSRSIPTTAGTRRTICSRSNIPRRSSRTASMAGIFPGA
ncbi:MAG: hypothetical protein AAB289_09935, partial [Chloroflexota bacterium]